MRRKDGGPELTAAASSVLWDGGRPDLLGCHRDGPLGDVIVTLDSGRTLVRAAAHPVESVPGGADGGRFCTGILTIVPIEVEPASPFIHLLQQQVGREFQAAQQYVALAVWFDARDLPQLAAHFYRQGVEERNHAMMMIQYLLDRGVTPVIPGVDSVRNTFERPLELIELALEQEHEVTRSIEEIFKAARDAGDFLGEQFMLWFLKEQVEEVASMSTLLTITERAKDDLFQVEQFIARERVGDGGVDPSAPQTAGGAL